jgi:peptidyl-prolyl cis-trans isomerase D
MGVVMGLLVISFAIWGIGDIFRGFGRSTVAKIGSTEISVEQFRQAYNDRLNQLSRQFGRPITRDQARALGLDRQLLSEMIAQAGLDERARQMRLALSDEEIARRIRSDPNFHGLNGQFDRARFEQLIRNAGYTEQRFVAEQRRITLRRQIIDSVSGGVAVPKAWLEAINRFQNEQRSIEYVAFGSAQAGEVPAPTAEQLQKYFNERKMLFRAPEYRRIVVIDATPAELAKSVEVSADDVKKAFEERRSRYVTPERRHIEQIVFPNMQEAQAAAERLKSGLSFAALAKERGLKEQDIDLGTIAKSAIIDKTVADAAFALKQGEVSAPVEGRFGVALLNLRKIEPQTAKTFDEVAPELRKDVALERAKEEVRGIYEKIEDARAGGSTLEEAAQKFKLPARIYEAVDRSGRGPDGKPVANLPDSVDVLSAAFASDVGVENDPLQTPGGGYIWFDVAGITPSRERALDEVKDQVEQRWRDDEIASRLKAKAADVLDKIKSGNPFADLAKANGVKLEKAEHLQRGKPSPAVPAGVIDAVFRTAKDAAGSAEGDNATTWFVFRVTDVVTPSLDAASPEAKRIDEVVKRQMTDDVFGEYIAQVESDLGISVSQTGLAQALGLSTSDIN